MNASIRKLRHFGNCLWLENGFWETAVSLRFGPRILWFSVTGCENVFYEQPEDADYLCTPEGWRVFGGTRLWLAPESVHSLYSPDSAPVEYECADGEACVTQNEDRGLHAKKRIVIRETDEKNTVEIEYRITNTGAGPLTGAPWAVSAMRAGGVLTVPFAASSAAITAKPERFVSLWNTTSLGDARLAFREQAVKISHLPMREYFKIGLFCPAGEARYDLNDQTFIKRFPVSAEAAYPDGGVNLEAFCCEQMLEFETLAPVRTMLPGETATHLERWTLLRNGL